MTLKCELISGEITYAQWLESVGHYLKYELATCLKIENLHEIIIRSKLDPPNQIYQKNPNNKIRLPFSAVAHKGMRND